MAESFDGRNESVSEQLEPHSAEWPGQFRLLVRMLVVIHRVVAVRVELLNLVRIAIADNVAKSPAPMFLNHMLFEYLAWFVDDQVRGNVDYGLHDILDYLDRLFGADG